MKDKISSNFDNPY